MEERVFNPIAAVLAWLWPGAGHLFLRQKRRGRFIMFGVLFLFVGGIFIGGVDSIDRRDDRLWFLAQGLCGPVAFAVDWVNQTKVKTLPKPEQYDAIAINKPNEIGTLFSAMAGLMNLIVILDAMFCVPREDTVFVERRKKPA
jgi:drug/metabolite transporter (DMT)-like permease